MKLKNPLRKNLFSLTLLTRPHGVCLFCKTWEQNQIQTIRVSYVTSQIWTCRVELHRNEARWRGTGGVDYQLFVSWVSLCSAKFKEEKWAKNTDRTCFFSLMFLIKKVSANVTQAVGQEVKLMMFLCSMSRSCRWEMEECAEPMQAWGDYFTQKTFFDEHRWVFKDLIRQTLKGAVRKSLHVFGPESAWTAGKRGLLWRVAADWTLSWQSSASTVCLPDEAVHARAAAWVNPHQHV